MTEEFNKEQYILLLSCSVKNDFSEWNEYVEKTEELIKLRGVNLEGIEFRGAVFQNKKGKGADFHRAIFKGAKFYAVDMSCCNFMEADLSDIKAEGSTFRESNFVRAKIVAGTFTMCGFEQSNFQEANLFSVNFFESSFQDCLFYRADLSKAKFYGGGYNPIVGKELRFNLCGAVFLDATFTNETYFHLANVSINTDFRTISFESACYSSGLRQTLQYCNRRHNWEDWYSKNKNTKSFLVRLFWLSSDYGRSPQRVIMSFSIICFFYALIYYFAPSLTSADGELPLFRSIYFSVVTMTTLGFGDISANASSWLSQLFLITHVLAGYVLLGALLTVLSNLFVADGPSLGLIKHPLDRKEKLRIHV